MTQSCKFVAPDLIAYEKLFLYLYTCVSGGCYFPFSNLDPTQIDFHDADVLYTIEISRLFVCKRRNFNHDM